MVMELPLPAKAQSLFLAFAKGQTEYKKHSQKKEYAASIF
jgi:hypothetical protein